MAVTARSRACTALHAMTTQRPIRRCLILGLGVVLAMLAMGCGGSQPAAEPSEDEVCGSLSGHEREVCGDFYSANDRLKEAERSESVETTTTEGPPEEVGGPLSSVGTMTGSDGHGTTFRDDYRLGPLLYSNEGTPPETVLNACRINDPTQIASSVFARGQVTTTYQEGSLPIAVGLVSWEELAQGLDAEGEQLFLITAFRLDGEWRCNSETEFGATIEFQPDESQTVPIWVIGPQVLTNAQPRVPASELNTWYFKFLGSQYGASSLTIHGPGAASCGEGLGEEERLLLYNRSGSC